MRSSSQVEGPAAALTICNLAQLPDLRRSVCLCQWNSFRGSCSQRLCASKRLIVMVWAIGRVNFRPIGGISCLDKRLG